MIKAFRLKFKEVFLSIRTKFLIKKGHIVRYNVNFQKANKVGVLYSYENSKKHNAVQKFVKILKGMGKKPIILCYTTDTETNYNKNLLYAFNHNNILLLGGVEGDHVWNFIASSFDYLFCLDLQGNAIINYLLAASLARCRVGNFDPERIDLFEIMVKFKRKKDANEIHDLAEQMVHYVCLLDGIPS